MDATDNEGMKKRRRQRSRALTNNKTTWKERMEEDLGN